MIQKRDFWKYFLLSIVTCGIYGIVFFYGWTEENNQVCAGDGKDSPNYILVLLLSLVTCGIYFYIWIYQRAQRLQDNAPRYGLQISDSGSNVLVITLLCSLVGVGPLVGEYILIRNQNMLAAAYNSYNFGNPGMTL